MCSASGSCVRTHRGSPGSASLRPFCPSCSARSSMRVVGSGTRPVDSLDSGIHRPSTWPRGGGPDRPSGRRRSLPSWSSSRHASDRPFRSGAPPQRPAPGGRAPRRTIPSRSAVLHTSTAASEQQLSSSRGLRRMVWGRTEVGRSRPRFRGQCSGRAEHPQRHEPG